MAGKKKPLVRYEYEPLFVDQFREQAAEMGAKMENINNPDVYLVWLMLHENNLQSVDKWLDQHRSEFSSATFDIDTDKVDELNAIKDLKPQFIVNRRSMNTIRHLNTVLCQTNEVLVPGGYCLVHARTTAVQKEMRHHHHHSRRLSRKIKYAFSYLWHQVLPRIRFAQKIYFGITGGKNRSFSRIELLGRICRAGFRIVDEEYIHGEFFVIGQKIRKPLWDSPTDYRPIIKLRRVGKGGEIIGVYKFRTMYAYSEYLQEYLYKHGGLQKGGKFYRDARVNFWGRILRKCWLDELPMIINMLKGQVKLVGVRPLSLQYFRLYSPEMQALRTRTKPGLIAPYYYAKVTPKNLEEIQANEREYLEQYFKHPFRTDWKYFWGCMYNVIIRRKRSH